MKGEVAKAGEKIPGKPVAKSMMEALRETAESLKLPLIRHIDIKLFQVQNMLIHI
jgi:hypothetical protein